MKKLGWQSPEDVVGQEASWSSGDMELAKGKLVGVVEDYYQKTMKNEIDPTVYLFEPLWMRTFLIRLETEDIVAAMNQLEAKWNEFFPDYPMNYHFLDDLYDQLYKRERQQLDLLYLFSGLALFVAFMGILGLVAYALRVRMKEMAIRKVLGARVADIVQLIGGEYLVLLLVGAALAIPISYYAISLWLENFAYHVEISPLSYALTLLMILALLLVTIGFQALKTSSTNSSEVLRNE